jgi:hypothetical protein
VAKVVALLLPLVAKVVALTLVAVGLLKALARYLVIALVQLMLTVSFLVAS